MINSHLNCTRTHFGTFVANSIVWRNFQQNFQYNQEERFVSHSNLKEQMWVPKPDRCRLCLCKMRTGHSEYFRMLLSSKTLYPNFHLNCNKQDIRPFLLARMPHPVQTTKINCRCYCRGIRFGMCTARSIDKLLHLRTARKCALGYSTESMYLSKSKIPRLDHHRQMRLNKMHLENSEYFRLKLSFGTLYPNFHLN